MFSRMKFGTAQASGSARVQLRLKPNEITNRRLWISVR